VEHRVLQGNVCARERKNKATNGGSISYVKYNKKKEFSCQCQLSLKAKEQGFYATSASAEQARSEQRLVPLLQGGALQEILS